MRQQEFAIEGAPIYVTANTLVSDSITLDDAMQIARDAGADGFELRRELLPLTMQPAEIQGIRSQLQRFRSPPAYSKPLPLFNKGRKRDLKVTFVTCIKDTQILPDRSSCRLDAPPLEVGIGIGRIQKNSDNDGFGNRFA